MINKSFDIALTACIIADPLLGSGIGTRVRRLTAFQGSSETIRAASSQMCAGKTNNNPA
jgi:hypothetical protein